jgi:hypothetical protein
VHEGNWLDASVAVKVSGGQAFLRLSWYTSDDGSGRAMGNVDSLAMAEGLVFARLSTGATQVPSGANSVRVRLMLRPTTSAALLV